MTTESAPVTDTLRGGGMSMDAGLAAMEAKRQQGGQQAPVTEQPAAAPAVPEAGQDETQPGKAEAPPDGSQEGQDGQEPEQTEEPQEEAEAGAEEPGEEDKVVLPDGTEMPVSELYAGYLRTQDYTRKTQALAEERRTLDTQRQQVTEQSKEIDGLKAQSSEQARALAQQVAQYQAILGEFAKKLDGGGSPWANTNWFELLEQDPIAYQRERLKFEQHERQSAQTRAAFEAEQRRAHEDFARLQQQTIAEKQQALQAWRKSYKPEWDSPDAAKADMEAMYARAREVGYSDDDIKASLDPRGLELLYESAQYRKLMAAKASVTAGQKQAPSGDGKVRIVKAQATAPRSSAVTVQRAAMASSYAQLSKSGSIEDGLRAMQQRRQYAASRRG